MSKGRLEAFSDGVFAVLITIMVLDLKAPHGTGWDALQPLVPVFLAYVLSFVFLGIYWTNHHHMLHAADRINGAILWANLHLLFWLSLVPFVTSWLDESGGPWPTVLYGAVLLMAAIAYLILQTCVVALQGRDSPLATAIGSDWKGKLSLASYAAACGLAFLHPVFSDVLYLFVALLWLIPDRRMEQAIS